MRKKLTNNLGLKLLALICAFFLWLVVVNINDPVDYNTFTGVQVELINTGAITDEGKIYEVLDNTDVINVTVFAKRSILNNLGKENIRAVADLSEVTITNTVSIRLSTNKNNGSLDSIDSSTDYLKLNIEDIKRKQLVIDTSTTGTPADGYMVGNVTSDQNLVRLSGPESVISRIATAQAIVEIGGMSENISTSVELKLFDADGEPISMDNITSNIASVNVNVSILAKKTVPITFNTMGTPADGYALTGVITGTPETIEVAGSRNVMDAFTVIEIPDTALNITGQTGDLSVVLNVRDYLPNGVNLADSSFSGSITVVVGIEKIQTKQLAITEEQIFLENIPEGFTAEIINPDQNSNIVVSGFAGDLLNVNALDMSGTVDVTRYFDELDNQTPYEGNFTMEVVFPMPENVTQTQSMYVTVRLTALTDEAEE